MICYTQIPSPLGSITLACDDHQLIGLWLEDQRYFPDTTSWEYNPELPVFSQTTRWLHCYFSGQQPDPRALPLAPRGSDFQKQVWNLLLDIPYGTVTTYGALAKTLNCKSPQAIGGAVGHNPISILIPCHRVIGKKGQLQLENTKP